MNPFSEDGTTQLWGQIALQRNNGDGTFTDLIRFQSNGRASILNASANFGEATAGTDDTRLMTPLRTRQAINATQTGWETWDGGDDATIWDHAVDGDTAIIESPNFSAGYDYRINYDFFTTVYGNSWMSVWESDTGQWRNLAIVGTSGFISYDDYRYATGQLEFFDPAKEARLKKYANSKGRFSVLSDGSGLIGGSISFRGFARTTPSIITKFRFTFPQGLFSGAHNIPAKVLMFRRKTQHV